MNNGWFEIIHAKEYEQKTLGADFEGMIEEAARLFMEYNCEKMFVDGSNPSFISSLREHCGLDPNYNEIIQRNKANKIEWDTGLYIIPIAFNKYARDMVFNTKTMLERGGIKIGQDKTELINALKNCKDQDGRILKRLVPNNHVLDCLFLSTRAVELDEGVTE